MTDKPSSPTTWYTDGHGESVAHKRTKARPTPKSETSFVLPERCVGLGQRRCDGGGWGLLHAGLLGLGLFLRQALDLGRALLHLLELGREVGELSK
jgi:hypothetical protein